MGKTPGGMARGEGSRGLSHTWAGAVGGTRQQVSDVPGKVEFQVLASAGQQSTWVAWEPGAAEGFSRPLDLGSCSSVLPEVGERPKKSKQIVASKVRRRQHP